MMMYVCYNNMITSSHMIVKGHFPHLNILSMKYLIYSLLTTIFLIVIGIKKIIQPKVRNTFISGQQHQRKISYLLNSSSVNKDGQ